MGKWSNLTNIFQMGGNHQLDQVHIPYIRCGWEMKTKYILIKWINDWRLKSEEWKLFKVVCFCCCCRLSNCGHPVNRVFCSKAERGTGSKITIHFLKQTWFTRDHQMIHSGRIKQYKSMWFWRIFLMTMHCLGWFITTGAARMVYWSQRSVPYDPNEFSLRKGTDLCSLL